MGESHAARGAMLALLAAIMFGIADAVAGGVFDVVSPGRVAQVRSLTAVVVITPFAIYRGVFRPVAGLWKLGILGANLVSVMFFFYWAIDLLGVGPAATIHFLGPIFVLIWFVVVRKVAVSPLVWLAAVASIVGVGLVTEAWSMDSSDVAGVLVALFAASMFASYLLVAEWVSGEFDPLYVVVWGFAFASVMLLVALPLWTFPTDISGSAWRDLAIIGLVGTAIPFLMEFAALRVLASSIVGVIATAEPAVAAIGAHLILDERLAAVQWLGVVVVVVSVATVQRWGLPDSEAEG
ncbi:MAG: EamA family transporter [Acidimicrobiia bacterium]|nr:EamA family transporter [Acidimicrobiia bacterium]